MEQERQSWICKFCNQWVRETFEFCGKCGHGWWEKPPPQTHQPYHPWNQNFWEEEWRDQTPKRSQSPRTPRGQHGSQKVYPPNKGKGKGKHKNKGKGKGKGNAGVPDNGKGKSKNKGKEETPPPWHAPKIVAPLPDNPSQPSSVSSPTLPPEIQSLLGGLRRAEANLPPEVQGLLQKTMQKTSQQTTKDMRSAIHRLGEARKALQTAKLARIQFHDQWNKYLSHATERWNGFIKQFNEQDMALAKTQEEAVSALKGARQQLELTKEVLQSSDRHLLLDSDEENNGAAEEVSKKIQAGIAGMAESLELLGQKASESAEQLQTEQGRLKRRKTEHGLEDAKMPDTPVGEGAELRGQVASAGGGVSSATTTGPAKSTAMMPFRKADQ